MLGHLAPFVEVEDAISGFEQHRRGNILTNFTTTIVLGKNLNRQKQRTALNVRCYNS